MKSLARTVFVVEVVLVDLMDEASACAVDDMAVDVDVDVFEAGLEDMAFVRVVV